MTPSDVSIETGRRVRFPVVWGIGRNYADHAAELGNALPERPLVFMKNPAAVIDPGAPLVLPPIADEPVSQTDYEGELAVVIGRDCRDVAEADALACVAGYAAANDVSARWWQKEGSGGQFVRGKSFDGFCPVGEVAPARAVADPQDLRIETRLNGETVQSASTASMIFTVAQLIAELSRGTTLLAGSLVLTGTPSGVGAGRTPPRFLVPGDRVEVEITGLPVLRHEVQAAGG